MSIIRYGNKPYKSPGTEIEVDWLKIGFAMCRANLSLYSIINIKELALVLDKPWNLRQG